MGTVCAREPSLVKKYLAFAPLFACTTTLAEQLDDFRAHHDVDCGWTTIDPPPMGVTCANTVASCMPDAMTRGIVAIYGERHGRGLDWDESYTITRDGNVLEFSDARCDEQCDNRLGYQVSRRDCTGLEIVTLENNCQAARATGCSTPEME